MIHFYKIYHNRLTILPSPICLIIFITFIEVSGCKIDKMAETQPSGEAAGRVKGVCVVKPIIYGNISQHFGKKRESDGHTHDWTVYLKPYENEDMSSYVKKVQFRLHESYPNPNRIVSKPPYEVLAQSLEFLFHRPTNCKFENFD